MKTKTNPLYYILFIAIFAILLPAGYMSGLISVNTISVWGRYFCFAIAALGIDLIWGYTGILSMCQAFFRQLWHCHAPAIEKNGGRRRPAAGFYGLE
jgi:urea transport system permease protein